MDFPLTNAERKRRVVTYRDTARIIAVYKRLSQEVQSFSSQLTMMLHSQLQVTTFTNIKNTLKSNLNSMSGYFKKVVPLGATEISDSVVRNVNELRSDIGLKELEPSSISDSVLAKYMSGDYFDNTWHFMDAVERVHNQIHERAVKIITNGMEHNKSAVAIFDELYSYISKVNGMKSSGGIDYHMQSLVRTMYNNVYQRALVESTRDMECVKGYIWHAIGSHTCYLCEERDGQIYTADTLPLDHINGQCDWELYIPQTLEEISRIYGL